VLTRRRDIQKVVSDFVGRCQRVVADYRCHNLYPLNMPVEIRVAGLDHAADTIPAGTVDVKTPAGDGPFR
jgi:Cholesterol oxidase, substrate-binding